MTYIGYRWMVPGMDGYRWKVLRMDAPRVQMASTRDGREAPRVQEDGTRDGST